MLVGTIAEVDARYRFGRIATQAFVRNVFFHCSEFLLAELDETAIGRRVSFEYVRNEKGAQACNVTLMD